MKSGNSQVSKVLFKRPLMCIELGKVVLPRTTLCWRTQDRHCVKLDKTVVHNKDCQECTYYDSEQNTT